MSIAQLCRLASVSEGLQVRSQVQTQDPCPLLGSAEGGHPRRAGANAAGANAVSRPCPTLPGARSSVSLQCTKTRFSSTHCIVSSWRFSGVMFNLRLNTSTEKMGSFLEYNWTLHFQETAANPMACGYSQIDAANFQNQQDFFLVWVKDMQAGDAASPPHVTPNPQLT